MSSTDPPIAVGNAPALTARRLDADPNSIDVFAPATTESTPR